MLSFTIFVFILYVTRATISPAEALFICKYNGVQDFPVPCSDAINACSYAGIQCGPQNGSTWNQTIMGLSLVLTFAAGAADALPTEIGNLRSLDNLLFYTLSPLLSSTIPTHIGLCTQLTSLYITAPLAGTLPSELAKATKLTYLEVGNTGLTGLVPQELSTLTTLTYLSLGYNTLSGSLSSAFSGLTNLQVLDLRNNAFTGTLPDPLSWSHLEYYMTSNNQFHGDMPSFASENLTIVDVANNLLNGTLPSTNPVLYTAKSVSLFYAANANTLHGTLPSALFAGPLVTLDLSYNALTGTIPGALTNAVGLEQLVISHNALSGSLPDAWHNFTFPALFRLTMDHNHFTGAVPSFGMAAKGRVSINYQPHIYLSLNDNLFNGSLPVFAPFPSSTSLDFSNNALSLTSASLGDAVNVSWLNLASNPIRSLPARFFAGASTRFTDLRSLDLSNCQITGTLPSFFSVQYLKLANNYFTGVVPADLVLQSDPGLLPVFVDLRLNRLQTDATRGTSIGSVSSHLTGEVVLTDFPQDVDECLLNTHACEYLCVDGWFPVPGYTCACPSGFALDDVKKRNCSSVCGDGLLRYPEEECDYEFSKVGCARNCTTKYGYRCGATGCAPICGDGLIMEPEECDNNHTGCAPTCIVTEGYTCSVKDNTCQLCSQSWLPFVYPPNARLFTNLRKAIGDDTSDFAFASCTTCDDGYALETREVLATKQCMNMSAQQSMHCSFACSNLTVFGSASEAIFTLQQELLKNGFLQQLFRAIFNLNITVNSSFLGRRRIEGTTEELQFTVFPCVSDKTAIMDVLRALSLDIVPNLPTLSVTEMPCGVSIRSTNPSTEVVISVVLTVSAFILFLMLAACVGLFCYYRASELHALPDDVSWSFLNQRTHPWQWEYCGSSKSGYYAKVYKKKSKDYRKVESLLSTHFKRGNLEIDGITAIYNPALSVSFVNQWRVMTARKLHSAEMFFSRTYTKDAAKMEVMNYYEKDLLQFTPYNNDLSVPLIPVLHGTDYFTAEKIAQTGFAALSSLDEGYFGKGIYFTTSVNYTLPYACNKRKPSLIVAYINPGNPYPVTEEHNGPRTLKGGAIKSGYNSHLVLTNKAGAIYHKEDEILCDELVVSQESQILPAWIVTLDIDSCEREFAKWDRTLVAPSNGAAIKEHKAQQALAPNDSIISMDDRSMQQPQIFYDSV